MKIRPLHDRVIVKRSEEERTTASGIVIPDSATEKPDQGVVQAIGSGKRDDSGKVIALDLSLIHICPRLRPATLLPRII